MFCRGSRKLAVKYRYYLKYNLMIAFCIIMPLCFLLLEYFHVIQMGKLRLSGLIITVLLLMWLVILILGCLGFGSVNALRYQIFGITSEGKLVHFWFKEMLRDGKVVLHFRPYHKKATKLEFIDVIKKKEEIIKDENFEDFLCALCNDEEVQRRSDILYEVMDQIQVVKETRRYIEVSYTIGEFGTEKKLKIYKNITHFNELKSIIKNDK